MSAICECVCGCRVIAGNPDVTPYLCSVCSLKEMRGDGEFHHLKRNPLPPTAEQTSIARFNALADQVRELRDATKQGFEDMNADFKALFDYVTRNQAMLVDDVRKALKRLNHARPNVAVAKKKAAPLVGKRKA